MYKFTKMITLKNEIHSTENARNFKNYEEIKPEKV